MKKRSIICKRQSSPISLHGYYTNEGLMVCARAVILLLRVLPKFIKISASSRKMKDSTRCSINRNQHDCYCGGWRIDIKEHSLPLGPWQRRSLGNPKPGHIRYLKIEEMDKVEIFRVTV